MVVLTKHHQAEGLLGGTITAEPEIRSDYRLDAGRLRSTVELDEGENVALLGDGTRRHAGFAERLHQRRDANGPIDERVLGVKMEMHEGRAHGADSPSP